MKIYTKNGDAGTTSLIGGERVDKCDCRVEAYGAVDELSANIALLRDTISLEGRMVWLCGDLKRVLVTLMTVEALLALGETSDKVADLSAEEIEWLENRIDLINSSLPQLTKFTIPGGHVFVSLCHICRTVCRRAEREAVRACREYELSDNALKYLNRLSDYLYVAGRKIAQDTDVEEECWEP